jgi:hypothetical protein
VADDRRYIHENSSDRRPPPTSACNIRQPGT